MRSVITNAGSDTLYTNTGSQFFVNVTHFSVAYVNGAERNRGLAAGYLEQLTSIVPSGTASEGEVIHNIWQTPFYNTDHAGVGGSLKASFASYYKYEYNNELDKNVLHVFPDAVVFSGLNPAFDALCGGYAVEIELDGISGSENSSEEELSTSTFGGIVLPPFNSKVAIANGYSAHNSHDRTNTDDVISAIDFFTSANMSEFLVPGEGGVPTYYATTPKYFPIKSWYPVKSSDINGEEIDNTEASVKIMNYEISLPGYASKDIANMVDIIENSIGNFRFNRIGVYATKMSSSGGVPGSITEFMPDQSGNEEPVLFAVIELNNDVDGKAKSNGFIKERSQNGAYEYNLDWQVELGVTDNPYFINGDRFYQESYRSQATTQLMQGIESTAVLAEAIAQLQFAVLELIHTERVGQAVALSDMVGNGNPNPAAGPTTTPTMPTAYGPWTDADGRNLLSVYGKVREGASNVSRWKDIPLIPRDFAPPTLDGLGFKADHTTYTLSEIGQVVNAMAYALVHFGAVKIN